MEAIPEKASTAEKKASTVRLKPSKFMLNMESEEVEFVYAAVVT